MTLKKVQTCSSVNNIATKFCPSCPQAAPKLLPNCQPQTASKLPPICSLLSAVMLKNQNEMILSIMMLKTLCPT